MTELDTMFGAAVVVPDVVDATTAGDVRAAADRAGYTRYGLIDRASYDLAPGPLAPEVGAAIVAIAGAVTGRRLAIASARILRLVPGDYLLARHDRLDADNPVEVVLDVSAAAIPDAEVHYRRRGQVFFRFASRPGAAAVVERGPTVVANHTYVSRRHAGARLVRVVAVLHALPP